MDIVEGILKRRGVKMPQNLIIQADNTGREQRNQWLQLYSGFLVAGQRFRSVSNVFFLVGHTHNQVDQRFVLLRAILNRAKVLQTPQDPPPARKNSTTENQAPMSAGTEQVES